MSRRVKVDFGMKTKLKDNSSMVFRQGGELKKATQLNGLGWLGIYFQLIMLLGSLMTSEIIFSIFGFLFFLISITSFALSWWWE
jgi:hypothetical protein